MTKNLLLFTLLFSQVSFHNYAQLKLRLNSEFGYYSSSGTEIINQDDLLLRLEGDLKYEYKENNNSASVQLRARPEFYSFKEIFSSIKLKADGDYYQQYEDFSWGIELSKQKNLYDKDDFNLTYDIFNLFTNFTFYFLNDLPFSFNMGYAYQTISEIYRQNLDLYYFDLTLFNNINENLKAGVGFYYEKFRIKNDQPDLIQKGEGVNDGYRVGPQFNLNYFKDFLLNIDYRFLSHISEHTAQPSFEQSIRLVAGFLFLKSWSALIYVEYYSRKFRYKSDSEDISFIEYIPINFENKIFLKIGYDISESFEVFIKSGYFKDNIYRNRFSFAGWNSLLGFEWRK